MRRRALTRSWAYCRLPGRARPASGSGSRPMAAYRVTGEAAIRVELPEQSSMRNQAHRPCRDGTYVGQQV